MQKLNWTLCSGMEQLKLLTAAILILALAACSGMMKTRECRVEDPNLEAAIREALNLSGSGEIDCAALAELTVLEGSSLAIERLAGLEHAVGLTRLDLSQNGIEDLGPLEGLTGLRELHLYGNKISDLSPLTALTELQQLHLNANLLQSLSPLKNHRQLEVLTVAGNRIRSLAPISDLTELRALDAGANEVREVTPLTGLGKLSRLYLDLNRITDISPLLDNPGLRSASTISVRRNCLDISDGSINRNVIGELMKSVESVRFEPQQQCDNSTT